MPRNGIRGRGRAQATLDFIARMVEIAAIYQPCSVRALAYQMFIGKLIASMGRNDVRKVSDKSVIAREEGTLPWEWITDSGREKQGVPTWDNPEEYARMVQLSYCRNKWLHQPTYVEVWAEKETVAGTLKPVLDRYEVPFQVAHGWCGATTMHDTAVASLGRHQDTLIIYVGDYDPSGMWMSEVDLPRRLARYTSDTPANRDLSLADANVMLETLGIRIRRVSLTTADALALGRGLGFPASDKKGDDKKKGDSRYNWFVKDYGHWCWELDALSPATLRRRVEAAIVAELDRETWDRHVHGENLERDLIIESCKGWKDLLRENQR